LFEIFKKFPKESQGNKTLYNGHMNGSEVAHDDAKHTDFLNIIKIS